MADKMNGTPVMDDELPSIPDDEPAQAAIPPAVATAKIKELVDQQVQQVMGIMIRGILVSSPGIPPNIVIPAIARACGKMLAMSITGSVEQTVKARGDMKAGFEDGLKQVPIMKMSTAVPPAG